MPSFSVHTVFESLAYFLGFQLFRFRRRRQGDFLPWMERLVLLAAMIAGGAIGSKLLAWLEDPFRSWAHRTDIVYLMSGKTVIGGLLGGLLAVEWMKKALGLTRRTGDLYAVPLAAGIAIGRIGCFLEGLADGTYGLPTNLPWGVDFGDGIPRHPTQLYEIAFLLGLIVVLLRREREPHREGDLFRLFLVAYMGFRLIVEFWKPGVPLLGLTSLQWACLALIWSYRRDLPYLLGRRELAAHG